MRDERFMDWKEPWMLGFQLFANESVFRIKPLKVIHFLQGSRKQPRLDEPVGTL